MTSRRLLKAAEAIREVVSMAILTELRDPRVRDVTVVGVEVAPDMREAKVRVSIMGDETRQDLSLRGLQNSAGYLQSRIADRIDSRYTPKLRFTLDKGLQNAMAVGEILDQIRREREAEAEPDAGAAPSSEAQSPPGEIPAPEDASTVDEAPTSRNSSSGANPPPPDGPGPDDDRST